MSRRGEILRLSRAVDSKVEKRRPWRVQFHGLLGDGEGNVAINSSDPRWVYVRREGRAVIRQVLNLRVGNIPNMPVLVGFSDEFPNTLQVLSIAAGDLGWTLGPSGAGGGGGGDGGTESYGLLANHASQHEFRRDGYGGNDVVWIAKQQITNLLIHPSDPAAMTVDVYKGWYSYGTNWAFFDATTSADLSGYVPGANLALWVLISIDTTADPHVLQYTEGTTFPEVLFPPNEDDSIPDAPLGSVPLAAIYFDSSTTSLTWANIYDMRLGVPMGVSGVMAAPAHELMYDDVHSDVDGDIDPAAGRIMQGNAAGTLWTYLDLGAAGGILKVNAAGTALEYLALGARGGILKVNATADALEYLAAGGAATILRMDNAGNDPEWMALGGAREVVRVNDGGTDIEYGDPIDLASAEIQAILDFAAGDLDLDTQNANEILAGPAAGAATKPAFRTLVAADIPQIPASRVIGGHTHVVNEDLSALCDGARTVFGLNNEAQPETTSLFKNGSRMRLDDDYTETDLYNSVTFGAAPGAADDVWIDYIPVT